MLASQLLELQPQQWQLLLVILPLVSLLFLLHRSRNRSGSIRLPPGPWQLPILGNLHQIGPLAHRSLLALSKRHGPVMMLRLGMVRTVVLSSPEAAREALKTHNVDCSGRSPSAGPRLLSYGYKDVIFSPYSDYVQEMRKLFILELLSKRRVQAACYARDAQVEKLVNNLTSIGTKPVPVPDYISATLDGIFGSFVFGGNRAAEKFKGQLVPVMNEAVDMLSSFSAEDFFANATGSLFDHVTGIKARRHRIFKKLDGFFEQVIEHYVNEDPTRKKLDDNCGSALLEELIDLWKKQNKITKDHVKAILMDTFVAGNDTSAITINWAMAELIRHPRVLKKVQEEIRTAVGKKERVQNEDMSNLCYLRMVVKETLRLRIPAALLVPRETLRKIQIAGYDIPAKTRVIVNAWAIARDPNVWKDPEEFYPERFEVMDIDFNGAHFELLPFGSGRRICPGMDMGVANVEFILANMLYCFNWELPPGMNIEDLSMEEEGALTIRKKTPLMLVPTRYTAYQ
ncbi:4-hydroxyphenylacetaldehyde oxime monooxygenase-like [Triticum dicoccoides]|uniref:4-hydroxyphenylacetaldehyde oxime monooxygenase-like n=1 Tax=Triticum dicoccoides TaxID=85692 RepID=UPI00188ECBF1|nr:4-hydroxyphenylacetaldehyde oxime monooxygenase-like [Triticum dicoccoides]